MEKSTPIRGHWMYYNFLQMKKFFLFLIAVPVLLVMWALDAWSSRTAIPQTEPTVKNQALLDALQGLSFVRYLDNPQFTPVYSQAQGWDVYNYRTDELRCILGGEFFILARRGAEADKTVVWLEGGGSCFPGRDDCSKEAQLPEEYKLDGLPSLDEVNPVKSWNFIDVPYCDGSLHLGDNDVDYDNDKAVDHWHWGLKTTSAAVQLMQKLFPASEKILLAGCSFWYDKILIDPQLDETPIKILI